MQENKIYQFFGIFDVDLKVAGIAWYILFSANLFGQIKSVQQLTAQRGSHFSY